jgi:hypothetical protein
LTGERDPSWLPSASQCIALRRSVAVRVAALAFACVAAVAVCAVVLPRGGHSAALALSAATFAALALAVRRHEHCQPAALRLEPDSIAAFDRSGGALYRGRIAGCAQWAGLFLMIAVVPTSGARVRALLVAADTLPAEAFRELAVRARHAAQ